MVLALNVAVQDTLQFDTKITGSTMQSEEGTNGY
jgi:hypothetical protein